MTDSKITVIQELRQVYGDEIILYDEHEESVTFHILTEFQWKQSAYAVLQSDPMKKTDDIAIYRMLKNDKGEMELESIEDDDEWEDVSEIYDEMIFTAE
jgi:uncharacterized protein YrzB (UPF0473 family)